MFEMVQKLFRAWLSLCAAPRAAAATPSSSLKPYRALDFLKGATYTTSRLFLARNFARVAHWAAFSETRFGQI